jgi:hypothetical protein
MELKFTDIEARAIVTALQKHLDSLDKKSAEKGMQLEIKTVTALLERIHSLPGAPGI